MIKFSLFLKKLLKFVVLFISTVVVFILILDLSGNWLFPKWLGSYNLGNGLYMLDWDKETRIIVLCSRKKGNTCYGGTYVIPHLTIYEEEYVETANANEKWVIVRASTVDDRKLCYYLIDKSFKVNEKWDFAHADSVIQSHIIRTFDSIEYKQILKHKGVNLKFYE